jgi:hypothetical protein
MRFGLRGAKSPSGGILGRAHGLDRRSEESTAFREVLPLSRLAILRPRLTRPTRQAGTQGTRGLSTDPGHSGAHTCLAEDRRSTRWVGTCGHLPRPQQNQSTPTARPVSALLQRFAWISWGLFAMQACLSAAPALSLRGNGSCQAGPVTPAAGSSSRLRLGGRRPVLLSGLFFGAKPPL